MEYFEGITLKDYIKQRGFLPQKEVRKITKQILQTISYCHSQGVSHRDLKPENILMDTDGYLKLSDYGLAKELTKGGKTYSFVGTPEYVGNLDLI